MNFTRDPIIETVITPREGYKLIVRSSKGAGQEDYLVDSLEVVSFGRSLFFRSSERPKSFLVPVSDYEVFESKEARMVLKNANAERSIKIGGGRDHNVRQREEEREESPQEAVSTERAPSQDRMDRKRDRQRRRSRRGRDHRGENFSHNQEQSFPVENDNGESEPVEQTLNVSTEETPKEKSPSFISKLFPPPSTLIKETLSRYKPVDPAVEDVLPMTTSTPEIPFPSDPDLDEEQENQEEE